MLRLQDAELRRLRRDEAPADHLRARPRQPFAVPEVRQGRTAPVCDLAAACLATPSPPDRGLNVAIKAGIIDRQFFRPWMDTHGADSNRLPRNPQSRTAACGRA